MDISIVLIEPEHELNIGFTARAMMNFGVSDLRLVNPKTDVGSEAMRFASHAASIVRNARVGDSMLDVTKGADLLVGTTSIQSRSFSKVHRKSVEPRRLSELLKVRRGKVSLVFGREGTGLNNQELELCDAISTIPTSESYSAMNISHAVAVFLYELQSSHSLRPELLASSKMRELISDHFESLLQAGGFPLHKRKPALRALRNIMGRSCMSRREASLILGGLRKASEVQSRTHG